ncbi:unnamed protein product [Aureobasidium vineae]|uniref:Uncharacterized protein n=1 Tax=Aureobasidium vineae TaxID=2773715 RepID=A0A9N8JCT7_9PEZI|nr:unnamed protein product [Aureobasidium vineae]
MGLSQWPTPQEYLEAERKSAEPAAPPTDDPASPVTIRWFTPSNYPSGRIWRLELVVFEPNERIFDRKPYQHNMVYWSQDTRTHLTREATCASAALQNGHRVFVATRGHSDTLDEDAVDVRAHYDHHQSRHN